MNINITGITIVRLRHGADHISLQTDLPDGMDWVGHFREDLTLSCDVARDAGPAYCALHFPGIVYTLVTDAGTPVPFSRTSDISNMNETSEAIRGSNTR